MKDKKNHLPFLHSAGMQKLLLICVCLLLCSLIYLYIGQNVKEKEAAFFLLPTASPTSDPSSGSSGKNTPTPTQPVGRPLELVIRHMQDAGFTLTVDEANPDQYGLKDDSSFINGTLSFFTRDALCCGFELKVEGAGTSAEIKNRLSDGDDHWLEQNSKNIAEALNDYREAHFIKQENYIYNALPTLLNALSADGHFINATASAWSALSVQARNTERLQSEEESGYRFSASRIIDDTIIIVVGF